MKAKIRNTMKRRKEKDNHSTHKIMKQKKLLLYFR